MTTPIYARPAELLQTLIRFDTTNPPGNEAACIGHINDLLTNAGFETALLAKDANRPNLVTRLAGRGEAPALVLQGHVDVVTTANQTWTHPPFEAQLIDGWVWGRGALDMKGSVAMMVSAVLRAKAEGTVPAGDIILTIMADEEAGSDYGARFLTEEHPEQFEGARYAIGEGGGSSQELFGHRFYTITVTEKQVCWMKCTLHGPGGHGARILRDGAMAKLGHLLTALNENRLPVHITPVMEQMVSTLAEYAPDEQAVLLQDLLDPARTDSALDALDAQGVRQATMLDALLHNTVNATVVRGGDKTNVIPSRIDLELDGRALPGYTPEDIMAELRTLAGDEELELEVIRYDEGGAEPDLSLVPLLRKLLLEADPQGILLPSMMGGFTDGRMFTRMGIQNYGFIPQKLPADFNHGPTVHGADERVPVETLEFGADVLYKLIQQYR
ncbi:MAG: M20/M25/M40 family metallo-hydrolase [Caldilineaceae bacterium]